MPFNPRLFLIFGLLAASVLSLLTYLEVFEPIIYIWSVTYSLMILTSLDSAKSPIKLFLSALVTASLATSFIYWSSSSDSANFTLKFFSLYALNSYHIAYHREGIPFKYSTLFHAVWDTLVKLAVAGVFALAAWSLLYIWSMLFELIGISFFSTLFQLPWFTVFFNSLMTAIGITIANYITNVIKQLRHVVLLICKVLLPALSAIALFFMISLIVVLISQGKMTKLSYTIFTAVVFFGIIFINGVFQKGDEKAPYTKYLLHMVNLFILSLPLFSLLALSSVWFGKASDIEAPISIYGFNAANFNAFILGCILFTYSIGYALAVLVKRDNWLQIIKPINKVLGVVVILSTALTNNYWFKLESFTSEQQQWRQEKWQRERQAHYEESQKALKDNHFSWKVAGKKSQDVNHAVKFAYKNDKPLLICRFQYQNQYFVGQVKQAQCQGVVHDKVFQSLHYDLLIGPKQQVYWGGYSGINKSIPVYIRFEKKAFVNINICRVIYQDRIRVGETNGIGYCRFAADGKVLKKGASDTLYIKTSTPSVPR